MENIDIRQGLKANMPLLHMGELGFCIDTFELFIGSSDGNKILAEAV
jgi:hypothetical protein